MATENLPDYFIANFVEQDSEVTVYVNEAVYGNCLKDNSYVDSGYRFHDIFHFAFAVYLQWSPCVRSMLKCKRKSNVLIDEVEDGGRAIIVEEAISLLAYSYAKDQNFYISDEAISSELIANIHRLSEGLEVERCSTKQWHEAIINGYKVFNQLRQNNGGKVEVSIKTKALNYIAY